MAHLPGNLRLRHFLLGKYYRQLRALYTPPQGRKWDVGMVDARAEMLGTVSASCCCASGLRHVEWCVPHHYSNSVGLSAAIAHTEKARSQCHFHGGDYVSFQFSSVKFRLSIQKEMLTIFLLLLSAVICSLGSLGYRVKLLKIKDQPWFSVSIYIFRQVFSFSQNTIYLCRVWWSPSWAISWEQEF